MGAEEVVNPLESTAGLRASERNAVYRVTGDDRRDYLHRMLTQDVNAIEPGMARHACLLNNRGRVLADLLLWNLGDALVADLPTAAVEHALPVLEKYVIADDVTFEDVSSEQARLGLTGPRAAAVLESAGADAPEPDRHVEATIGATSARVLRSDLTGHPNFEIAAAAADAAAVREALIEAGAEAANAAQWDALRVALRRPAYGPELGPSVLFNEAPLEHAVSWAKGCFPGQEPVVMARDRGHPPRLLASLAVEGGAVPVAGASILKDGETVGTVTTVAAQRALGFVRHADAKSRTRVELEGGGTAVLFL